MKRTSRDKEKFKKMYQKMKMHQMESQVSEKALETFRRPAYARVPLKNKHESNG